MITIKVIDYSQLKGISKNVLDTVLTYKTGIKTDRYWLVSLIQIPLFYSERSTQLYNHMIMYCINKGYSYLQINNK